MDYFSRFNREAFLRHKLLIITSLVLIIALPLILFAAKQRQETRTQATAATSLFFNPASSSTNPIVAAVGGNFSLDVMVNPGTNLISLAKIEVTYDPNRVILLTTNPVVVNTAVFPTIVEGPITSSGKVVITVSVGADQTKVVQTTSKVLTLNFKAVSTTSTNPTTSINYGINSALYSIAPSDSSNENVLASTTNAVIKINPDATVTPSPTSGPTPTPIVCVRNQPQFDVSPASVTRNPGEIAVYTISTTNTDVGPCADRNLSLEAILPNTGWTSKFSNGSFILPLGEVVTSSVQITSPTTATGGNKTITLNLKNATDQVINTKDVIYNVFEETPTPSPTPKVTNTPTPSPSPTPAPLATIIKFTEIKLHGIGKGGDSPNPNSTGTLNPLHPTRNIVVEIYSSTGSPLGSVNGTITYSGSQTGIFTGQVTLPGTFATDTYLGKIKTPQYLVRGFPGFLNITKGQTTNVAPLALVAGDVDGDNFLKVADYNIIMDCYSDIEPAKNCTTQAKKDSADLSDDGRVDQDDYNLFLRELSVQQGD